jgi:hypothetical protein
MKNKKMYVAVGLVSIMCWQCSKTVDTAPNAVVSTQNLTLKESITTGVAKVNYALTKISETQGFKILNSQNVNSTLALSSFKDSITLGLIAGLYEFQTDSLQPRHFNSFARLFKKTGTSTDMIVKLPQKFILYPYYLRHVVKQDSTLSNNFIITASDYHYYYSDYSDYDYKLSAGFVLDSSNIGSLDVVSAANSTTGSNYAVKYSFNNGYYLNISGLSNDTTQSMISLSSDTGTLLKESVNYVNAGYGRMRENQYILSIGNVEIKRTAGIDSIQVYLNGVLQKKAGARITDNSTNNNGSICHSRDIQITFDDGTTTTLSALLNPSLTILKSVVSSLQSMYFASNVIDYIAFTIYDNSN